MLGVLWGWGNTMNNKDDGKLEEQSFLPLFGSHFLEDHARTLMSDPKIALIELIANCWDAGANRVDITWPEESVPDLIEVRDDGTGMTYEQFIHRWLEFNYNRKEEQGSDVIFPPDNIQSNRKAYGTNGKGRHSMFCFSNEYYVETWRDSSCSAFTITRSQGVAKAPFILKPQNRFPKEKHGTVISTELAKGESYLEVPVVRELIGAKFVTDPGFTIYVNGQFVEMTTMEHFETKTISVKNIGDILIHCVDSQKTGRTSRQHGVAWWVNKRLVGEPSWREIDDFAYLDARTVEARRYTFIVEADVLADAVKEDWSGFEDTESVKEVKAIAKEHIRKWLGDLLKDVHKLRKKSVISTYKGDIKKLPAESRYRLGQFVDEMQNRVTMLEDKVLKANVEVLLKLEQSRSGFALLEQLSKLDPTDIDSLNKILEDWTVQEARIVLDELGRRLKVIESLEKLVEDPSSDELHELQPLFEKGLWIFGPEYESIQFTSNKSLATVIKKLLGDKVVRIESPRRRPDFIALPDSSIGIYSCDSFDDRGEVAGIGKVLIVEIKRGGFVVTNKEMRQAEDYASEIRKSGKVARDTQIEAFVLGTTIADDAREPHGIGEHTKIRSETYSTTLNRAHARTFNLLRKIEQAKEAELYYDKEIEEVLSEPDQMPMNLN
jgi:hypothetical protein